MALYVERPGSGALQRRLAELQEATRPGSRVQARCRADIRQIVVEDHADMLVRGVDRYGVPRAPLAESTLKNRRRGPGPSLIPRGLASRFATHFEAVWLTVAGALQLACRYRDILSKQGKTFVQYHMTGTRYMPRRDTGGVTPKGWAALKARFARLPEDIRTGGGG
jgi:hypothetical protein